MGFFSELFTGPKKAIKTEKQIRKIDSNMHRKGLNPREREEVWQRMKGHIDEPRPEDKGIDLQEFEQTTEMMREDKTGSHNLSPKKLDTVEEAFREHL